VLSEHGAKFWQFYVTEDWFVVVDLRFCIFLVMRLLSEPHLINPEFNTKSRSDFYLVFEEIFYETKLSFFCDGRQ